MGLGAEATMALVPYDPGGAGVRPPGKDWKQKTQ
mgnify:FL=1